MSVDNSNKNKPKEHFYLLPNLLTTAGLFFGFYAIISSINNQFEHASVAIFIAMIFDGLDGRVARMTNTQSEFGAQYDSMADIVSFGIAPAILTYSFCLSSFGKLGWLACFIFVACAALRLARFNSMLSIFSKNYFQGLPSPAAAALVASMVWVLQSFELENGIISLVVAVVTVLSGLLMVSNFRYSAFKNLTLLKEQPFVSLLIAVFLFVVIAARPAEVLFITFFIYALSGAVLGFNSIKFSKLNGKNDADFNDSNSEVTEEKTKE